MSRVLVHSGPAALRVSAVSLIPQVPVVATDVVVGIVRSPSAASRVAVRSILDSSTARLVRLVVHVSVAAAGRFSPGTSAYARLVRVRSVSRF